MYISNVVLQKLLKVIDPIKYFIKVYTFYRILYLNLLNLIPNSILTEYRIAYFFRYRSYSLRRQKRWLVFLHLLVNLFNVLLFLGVISFMQYDLENLVFEHFQVFLISVQDPLGFQIILKTISVSILQVFLKIYVAIFGLLYVSI